MGKRDILDVKCYVKQQKIAFLKPGNVQNHYVILIVPFSNIKQTKTFSQALINWLALPLRDKQASHDIANTEHYTIILRSS